MKTQTSALLSRLLPKRPVVVAAEPSAAGIEIIAHPDAPNKALAFGMTWRTIVTANNGRDAAIKMVRAQKGNAFVYRTSQVGFGRVTESQLTDVAVVPASVAAARLHDGNGLLILNTYPGEYWVAATRNGSPTALDRYLKGATDSDALAVAEIALDQSAGDAPTVFTNLEHHPYSGVKKLGPEDLFDVPTTEEDRLRLLPKPKASIPKPVLMAIGVAMAVLLGQSAYKHWTVYQRQRLASLTAVIDEPPEVAWGRAIADWQSKVAAPDGAGLEAVRQSMGELPALWHGWWLGSAACKVTDTLLQVDQMQRVWSCSARYDRTPSGLVNREMQAQIPPEFQAEFTALNQMVLGWRVTVAARKIDIAEFQSEKQYLINATSELQRLEPILTQAPNLVFGNLNIPAPRRSDGTGIPPIDKVKHLRVATLSISGPLRSIDEMLANDFQVSWKSLQLTFNKDGDASGLTSSVLMAVAMGDLYAKQ